MVHDSFSSHSEGEVEFPQAFEIAEQFGTPPTRSRSIGKPYMNVLVQHVDRDLAVLPCPASAAKPSKSTLTLGIEPY